MGFKEENEITVRVQCSEDDWNEVEKFLNDVSGDKNE